MEIVRGKPSVSYGELPSYLYMLEYTNPGTVTRLHKSDEGRFLYTFVSLYSSIKGWEYCRPIMVVDGSLLKAAYRGTVLTACTLDAASEYTISGFLSLNGSFRNIFPLAYALIDSENDASWGWFFMQLKNTFGVREGMRIVSDRHDSIQNATSTVYPEVPHCFCIYHLWNNVKDLFRKNKEKARPIFFTLAKAYTTERFEHYMNELNKIDRRVQPYLFSVGYERWSRVFCRVKRTIFMTSNIVESMNSTNKFARELPVRRLLEFLTKLMTQWSYENRKHATKSTELGKMYNKKLKKNMIASQNMTAIPSTD
ncbi:uncharacterized protein LOC132637278 [Lycium barbarum]|uniref:uncharacterized protein LOC132637278 n=1 Tax=Lycium barbarum TaxID=112863 RepID=UPI00293EC405|nr:uncharacterized protein LOC132637278 [Lycium barbarum]